jgi:hypothetical protein
MMQESGLRNLRLRYTIQKCLLGAAWRTAMKWLSGESIMWQTLHRSRCILTISCVFLVHCTSFLSLPSVLLALSISYVLEIMYCNGSWGITIVSI